MVKLSKQEWFIPGFQYGKMRDGKTKQAGVVQRDGRTNGLYQAYYMSYRGEDL